MRRITIIGGRKKMSRKRRILRRAPRVSVKLRRTIASVAKRVVSRRAETKYVSANILDATQFNSTVTSTADCYPVLPPVGIGGSDYQRIGSRIRPKSLVLMVKIQYVGPQIDNTVEQLWPATCRLMVLENKIHHRSTEAKANFNYTQLLDDRVGGSAPRPYLGGQLDNFAPINTDLYKVLFDGKVTFNWDYYGNMATAGAAAGNNPTRYAVIKIKCPQVLDYNDDLNEATNFAPFMLFGYTYDNGEGPDTLDRKFILSAQSRLYFTDE